MVRLVKSSQHVAGWQEQGLAIETVVEDSVFLGPFLDNRRRRGLKLCHFYLGETKLKLLVFTHRALGFCRHVVVALSWH